MEDKDKIQILTKEIMEIIHNCDINNCSIEEAMAKLNIAISGTKSAKELFTVIHSNNNHKNEVMEAIRNIDSAVFNKLHFILRKN
ncbi:MAG: hypothetical protein H6622_13210 [Halobacteriovoraceae bacterium]|nr:hypothetical protein [Halobacteriovoraceae bacterium]